MADKPSDLEKIFNDPRFKLDMGVMLDRYFKERLTTEGYMTGQEWYDLMMDVIHDQPDSFQEAPDGKEVVLCYPLAAVERAAKRASGIEEV